MQRGAVRGARAAVAARVPHTCCLRTISFANAPATWCSAVRTDLPIAIAISLLVLRYAISSATRRSWVDSPCWHSQ